MAWIAVLSACTDPAPGTRLPAESEQANSQLDVAESTLHLGERLDEAEARLDYLETRYEGMARIDSLHKTHDQLAAELRDLENVSSPALDIIPESLDSSIANLELEIARVRFMNAGSKEELMAMVDGLLKEAETRLGSSESATGSDSLGSEREKEQLEAAKAARDSLGIYYQRLAYATEREIQDMRPDIARASAILERTMWVADTGEKQGNR
jgi:hypothetical protein